MAQILHPSQTTQIGKLLYHKPHYLNYCFKFGKFVKTQYQQVYQNTFRNYITANALPAILALKNLK